jgi:hypothetical protein
MARNKNIVDQEKQDINFERYDYGNLVQQCFVCGEEEIKLKDINGGLQFFLPTTDKHEMRLTCGRCGSSLRLFFERSSKVKTEEEKKVEQEKQQADIQKYMEMQKKEVTEKDKDKMVVSKKKTIKTVKKDAVHKGRKKEKPIRTDRKNT